MDIQNIINVTLTVASPGVTAIGFGEPGILFYGDSSTPSVNPIPDSQLTRRYSSSTGLADMVTDGFATTDPAYLAAQAVVSQTPHPQTFKLLRGGTEFTWDAELLPQTDTTGETIEITISKAGTSRTYTRTAVGGGIPGEATAIAFDMNNDASGFGSGGTAELLIAGVGNDVELDATAGNEGEVFYLSGNTNFTITDVSAIRGATGIADDLAAIVALDADWYGLVLADAFGALEIASAAAWVSGQTNKILLPTTQDTLVATAGTGIGATLSGLDRTGTFLSYSRHSMAEYLSGAAGGRFLPETPGTEMWAYKNLAGVTPSNLPAAQIAFLEGTFTNVYTGIEAGGVEIVQGNLWKGWNSGSSEGFIDTTRLVDATVAEVQTRVLTLFRTSTKVPYTNKGFASMKGAILASVRNFMPLGYDEGTAFVGMPNADDISTANKAARILPGVTFGATLAGGIARVNITGTLSV